MTAVAAAAAVYDNHSYRQQSTSSTDKIPDYFISLAAFSPTIGIFRPW